MFLNESIVEDAAPGWFGEVGYAAGHGPQFAPGEPAAERDSFSAVVLVQRLREAILGLNPATLRSIAQQLGKNPPVLSDPASHSEVNRLKCARLKPAGSLHSMPQTLVFVLRLFS